MKVSILSNLFTTCWWWLLFWMFASFLLGWLLRKLFSSDNSDDNCCKELNRWKTKYASLEKKYNVFLSKKEEQIESLSPEANVAAGNFIQNTAKSTETAFSKLKSDNLQIIEGIGPKMDEVLKKHAVSSWHDLSNKSFDDLRGILDKENPKRYKIINPKTWAAQAKLADEAKWEDLISLQKDLDAGKTSTLGGQTDSKLEKVMIRLGLLKRWKQDDLKAIEGIGPKIARLFIENGIDTWQLLSKASVSEMNKILASGGDRFKLANPGSWAEQAKLADEGKWKDLQDLQDLLDGGR